MTSAAQNMSDTQRLVSPSVTDRIATLASAREIQGSRADEVTDVLDQGQQPSASLGARRRGRYVAVEVAALAGVDLQRRRQWRGLRSASFEVLLVALDDVDRHLVAQQFDGLHEQRRSCRAGAGDEVERKDAALVRRAPVGVSMVLFFAGCPARSAPCATGSTRARGRRRPRAENRGRADAMRVRIFVFVLAWCPCG